MKWDIFQKFHDSLTKKKVDPHTRMRILYSTINGKKDIKECTFEGLQKVFWNIYDNEKFAAVAIFIIQNKSAQPVFRYILEDDYETRPQSNGFNIVKDWNKKPKRMRSVLIKMLVNKIEMEINERNINKRMP